jgi:hydroxymethylbilane synthase
MLPAPAQGAIMIVSRINDSYVLDATATINNPSTAACTKIERDFLRKLLGGCSTPISAFAEIINDHVFFKGNILSLDGKEKAEIELIESLENSIQDLGEKAAQKLLNNGGEAIAQKIRNTAK